MSEADLTGFRGLTHRAYVDGDLVGAALATSTSLACAVASPVFILSPSAQFPLPPPRRELNEIEEDGVHVDTSIHLNVDEDTVGGNPEPSPPHAPPDSDPVSSAPNSPISLGASDTSPPVQERPNLDIWRAAETASLQSSASRPTLLNRLTSSATTISNTLQSPALGGVIELAQDSSEVQSIGKSIAEDGVPVLLDALEVLAKCHPFVEIAFLPFKLIYYQEVKRRENDLRRLLLFELIKDVMLALVELESFTEAYANQRTTPAGEQIQSRIATVCEQMQQDIEGCYNVLNAHDKSPLALRFLKAASWNKVLADYGARFKATRDSLVFALQLENAGALNSMRNMLEERFSTILTPAEELMGRWISDRGGEEAVLDSPSNIQEVVKYENSLACPASTSADDAKDDEATLNALRDQYRTDIMDIINANLGGFLMRFELGLEVMQCDLKNDIAHQGDRVINSVDPRSSSGIWDETVARIWEAQDYKERVDSWSLMLALRTHLLGVDGANSSFARNNSESQPPSPQVPAICVDNPDGFPPEPSNSHWIDGPLEVQHLRSLSEAIDTGFSGFISVQAMNRFTSATHQDGGEHFKRIYPTEFQRAPSVSHWMAYWAVGWQVLAERYCGEIEERFRQISFLRTRVAVQIPENEHYIAGYLENTEKHVIALTLSVADSNAAAFQHIYYVDSPETVTVIIGTGRLEQSVFILLVLLLRRHQDKLNEYLERPFESSGVAEEIASVTHLMRAVSNRFVEIKELLARQPGVDLEQRLGQISCGLASQLDPRKKSQAELASSELVEAGVDKCANLAELSLAVDLAPPTEDPTARSGCENEEMTSLSSASAASSDDSYTDAVATHLDNFTPSLSPTGREFGIPGHLDPCPTTAKSLPRTLMQIFLFWLSLVVLLRLRT
ncbi:hypothetical protein C8R43DRAFT_1205639 [Mycena crocata]|nr:hypothetical protein C8R43DRAFT_1205639 [Mycena crocata]